MSANPTRKLIFFKKVISIHKAISEDIPRVFEIETEVTPNPWKERYFVDEIGNPLSFFYVARDDESGDVGGYIVFWLIEDVIELHNIAVSKNFQRRGIANALMDTMVKIASECEIREIFLEVRASNAPAIALYEKFGFTPAGVRKNYYTKPREDALLYRKCLQ